MGSKTKTVGGGQATGTANAFNDWMKQGLTTGNFGTGTNGQPNAFGGAIQNQLGGGAGTISPENQKWFQGAQSGTGTANLPGTPAFRETTFDKLDTGGANYGGSAFDSLFGKGGQFGGGGFGPAMGSAGMVNFNSGNYAKTANAIPDGGGALLNVDYNNNPEMKALVDMQNRQKGMDQANVRARFGALGTGLSSGASLAESQYLAEANPRNTLALGELGRSMQGLDMQNRGQNYNALLGQMGIQSGERGQNMQADLGAATTNANNQTSVSMGNAGNANNFGMQQMAAMLQAKGMDADNAFKQAGLIANNMQQNNANTFGNNTNFNNFSQGNYNTDVNAALQNQQLGNNWAMGQAGIGQNLMGMGNAGQQGMINGLMNQFGNINQLGTAQAQTVEKKNPWMEGLTAIGGIAQGIGGLMSGMGSFKAGGNGFATGGKPSWMTPSMPGSFGGSGNGGIPSQGIPGQWSPSYAPNNSASFGGNSMNLMAPQNPMESAIRSSQNNINVMQQMNPQMLQQLMAMQGGGNFGWGG